MATAKTAKNAKAEKTAKTVKSAKAVKAAKTEKPVIAVKGKAKINWDYRIEKGAEYTDLGKYIIDLGIIDQEAFEKGRLAVNEKVDTLPAPACTGVVKRNSKGEVIMGRNQDLEISNYPAFIAHLVGGKYQAICFNYNNIGTIRYDEFQKGVKLPENFRETQAAAACDAFNEKGLYIQCDMRVSGIHVCSGTNPGGLRVCMGTLAPYVAQNCATVKEALEYLETLDIYSPGATKDGQARAGWDGGYMIGDATGEFGVIEFSHNKMFFTPYANGHANFFVNPELTSCDPHGAGYGRLAMAQRCMVGAETAEDMMEAIHLADWRRFIEDVKYSYKDEKGYIHFQDKDGNPSIDFRGELTQYFAISDDGHYIPENYDWLKQFALDNDTVESLGYIGSMVLGALGVTEKQQKKLADDISEYEKYINSLAAETIMHYHNNCTASWLMNPDNFDEVKQATIDFFEKNNAFELIEKFHAGDDKPIRDKGDIFTTGMNFGVNCSKKYLMVRFFEDPEAVYEYKW